MKISAIVFALATLSLTALAADLTGTWKAEFDTPRGLQKYTFTLKQDGASVSGKVAAELDGQKREAEVKEGKVAGDTVTFVEPLVVQDNELRVVYTGKVSDGSIELTRQVGEFGSTKAVAKLDPATVRPEPAAAPGGRRGPRGRANNPYQNVPPGPPMPVPPAVSMLRPTAEEVARINTDLTRYIASNASPERDLLKKYSSLLALQVPRVNPAICPAPSARGGRHDALVRLAQTGDFDLMFLGDSITDLWSTETDPFGNSGGKPVFDKYFAAMKVANFGVSGDTTQGILWGLQNGEGQGHKPKVVMLMIGTNNTGSFSAGEIAEGVGADVLELRKDFPDAKILLLAIFPRGTTPTDANRVKVEAVNRIIARLDDQQHVFFMNINAKFLDEKGGLIGFRPSDALHPVTEGYEIWASAVAATLRDLTK